MKALGIIVNIFIPGLGTIIAGQTGTGIVQILLYIFGLFLTLTVVGVVIGGPLMFVVWIWSIISVASMNDQPVQVVIVDSQNQRPAQAGDTGDATVATQPQPLRTVVVNQPHRSGSGGCLVATLIIFGLFGLLSVSSYWYYTNKMKPQEVGPTDTTQAVDPLPGPQTEQPSPSPGTDVQLPSPAEPPSRDLDAPYSPSSSDSETSSGNESRPPNSEGPPAPADEAPAETAPAPTP